ncbi:PREDICTED: telomere length regulation protein TEL2 homolog [Ceratosolen solmsi marchali]|uniref:Telomere length regulation protein TEL2 homolog n=1 Tax=Ceratosolen solmsi marchali TaxID=326594 RepID=A0AAJ6YWL7_9HYME|nr:PREDICTED: telomere length regulation protein TEL2 homolog [Ceratosolen solmsi marchali]
MMNMWKVRELVDRATNVVMNYTETEAKVREATNDDAWGPTGAMMQELTQATFTYEQFPEVMSMLWKRLLQENKRNWRRTYKSLLLLNYLVRNGSERVVTSSREHIYDLRSLENYTFVDEFGKDQGINIRHKVRELIDFIQDDDKLREERKKAKKNKDKYIGMSSKAMAMCVGSGGGDRWMDNPKWSSNKSSTGTSGDGYNDWDRENRPKGFEDENNSITISKHSMRSEIPQSLLIFKMIQNVFKTDDGDREDSDNEAHTSSKKNSGSGVGERREYRDAMDSIERVSKPTTSVASTNNSSPTRVPRIIKKVDLGAAANYGKDQVSSSPSQLQPTSRNKNDIFNDIFDTQNDNNITVSSKWPADNNEDDDFNPRAENYAPLPSGQNVSDFGDFTSPCLLSLKVSSKWPADNNEDDDFNPRAENYAPLPSGQNVSDFGDFTSAFSSPSTKTKENRGSDEFADFTSAFNSSMSITQQPQMSLINPMIPSVGSPVSDNLIMPMNARINTSFTSGNDLFNATQPQQPLTNQPQIINNSNNNATMSNTDLLSDLTDFNASLGSSITQTNNLNNANLFNSDPIGPLNNSASSGFEETRERHASHQLLEVLRDLSTHKSQSSLKRLRGTILEYLEFLPGPLTPQKCTGQDSDYELDVLAYSRVLESLVEIFDCHFPLSNEAVDATVCNLFILDGASCQLLNESLLILTQALKKADDARLIECFGIILEKLIKSDALLSAIMLISLPNRVANKMQRNLLECFKLKNFASIVCFATSRAIYTLNEALYLYKIEVDTAVMSMLISKIFFILNSNDLLSVVDIITEWCISNVNNIRPFVQKILLNIEAHSVENVAILFLKHSRFVPNIFGDLIRNDNWRHTLATRIPLMSWYKDEQLIKNFISYLYHAQSADDRILVDITKKLIDIWGDQSALNHTTFDQHLYITKLIILAVRIIKSSLLSNEQSEIQQLVFAGIPAHLSSTEVEVRAIGMVTGEILTELLVDVKKIDDKLKFEYDGMDKNTMQLVNALRALRISYPNPNDSEDRCKDLTLNNMEFPNLGMKKVFELGVECGILTDPRASIDERSTHTVEAMKLPVKKETMIIVTENAAAQDEELDSDDDLVPYDMSNDARESERLKPLYLRDLRDNLVNTDSKNLENPEIFSETLKISEELIIRQLGNDDPSFACELLEIFLNLQERGSVDDFEVLTFKACVAIVTVHPNETAKYICVEFHSELSKYSVQQRLLMLNILCEAASSLSRIPVTSDISSTVTVTTLAKRKKLSRPINLFIETDKSKKYESMYDDDYDDPTNDACTSIDWYEIVQDRIHSKTRHFAHETKLPKTTINKFGNFVSSFFYPLIYGFGNPRQSFMYELPQSYQDHESILLTRYLETLATIMIAAQNCPLSVKMAKEILELAWTLRYHERGRVRLAIMKCVAAVLISVPEFELKRELLSALMEIRLWLVDATKNSLIGDPDKNCQELGKHVLYLINSIFQEVIKQELQIDNFL